MRTASLLALTTALALTAASAQAAVTVKVDAGVGYQTIKGWLAMASDPGLPPALRDELLDDAVNGLGLTGLVWGPPFGGARSWEALNDDDNPQHIKWKGFNTGRVDALADGLVVPFRRRVSDGGAAFTLIATPWLHGSDIPVWLLNNPAEHAEYVTSFLLHLKTKHDLAADFCGVAHPIGYGSPFTVTMVRDAVRALGPRLKESGLDARIEAPHCNNLRSALQYCEALRRDTEAWSHVGLVTYAGRGRPDETARLRDLATAAKRPLAMLGDNRSQFQQLVQDLSQGHASYWCGGTLVVPGNSVPWSGGFYAMNYDGLTFHRSWQHWQLRQVMRYVRPGAMRVKAECGEKRFSALAFIHYGRVTVILYNQGVAGREAAVTVTGLPPGTYGVAQTAHRRSCEERGVLKVDAAGRLDVDVLRGAVATIYPHTGINQPPVVTDCGARPTHLTVPATDVYVGASATDPERDDLTYAWRVLAQPAGAKVTLDDAKRSRTRARNLTVPGDYLLCVTVADGKHTVVRHVKVRVFAENQPPVAPRDLLHNRDPFIVTQPASATTLQGTAWDLDGERLTYRWVLLGQPAGAAAKLENATAAATKVSGMTAPGDYFFRFQVSDSHQTVSEQLFVTVHPPNNAPAIGLATADPAVLAPPLDRVDLAVEASDPDGDPVTQWWSVRRAPRGARVVFVDQHRRRAAARGLTVPGAYEFQVAVMDQSHVTRKTVAVTVKRP